MTTIISSSDTELTDFVPVLVSIPCNWFRVEAQSRIALVSHLLTVPCQELLAEAHANQDVILELDLGHRAAAVRHEIAALRQAQVPFILDWGHSSFRLDGSCIHHPLDGVWHWAVIEADREGTPMVPVLEDDQDPLSVQVCPSRLQDVLRYRQLEVAFQAAAAG